MGCLASKEAGAGGGGPGAGKAEVASSVAQQHNATALVQQEVAAGAKHSSSSGAKAEAAAAQHQQAAGDKKDKSPSSPPQSAAAVAEVSKQQQPTEKVPAAVTPPSPVRASQGGVDNPVSPTDIQLVNNSSTNASPRATEAAPVSKRRTDCKLRDVYKLGKTLGTGGFSIVKLAIEKSTGKEYACKIMALPPVGQEVGENENTREDIFKEIDLLCGMNHENVIYLKEYYEEGNKVFLITELLTGGELLDAVLKRGSYSEAEARNCFVQLLRGIAYLHSKHVTHRDLKLENLLLASPDDMTRVKIADFGLAKHAVGGMQTICGTPQYVAPEVIVGHKGHVYGPSVDMWSAGVVLYILLGGYPPFWSESEPQLFDQIRKGKYSFDDPVWQKVSDSAKDLIRRLLVVDPRKRLTAEQALHHPWLTDGLPTDAPALTGAQQNMQKQFRRKFRQAVGTVIGISRMQHMVSAVKAGELPAGNLAHDQALYQRMTHAAKQFEDAEQRKTNGGHSPRRQQPPQQQPQQQPQQRR